MGSRINLFGRSSESLTLYRDIVSLRIGQIMEEKSQKSPTDINDAEVASDSLNPAGDFQLKGT